MFKIKLIFNMLLCVTVCFSADADVFQDMDERLQESAQMKEQVGC